MGGRLEGRRAIVTGAGNGIGRATALKLAAEGARVGCIDVNGTAAADSVSAITDAAGSAVALVADVSDEAQVERAVAVAEETSNAPPPTSGSSPPSRSAGRARRTRSPT